MEWTEKHEAAAKRLLEKWEKKDPYFKERQEYGKLLMIHIDDFTPAQRKRYIELGNILRNADNPN